MHYKSDDSSVIANVFMISVMHTRPNNFEHTDDLGFVFVPLSLDCRSWKLSVGVRHEWQTGTDSSV